jgi:hypothetical protein
VKKLLDKKKGSGGDYLEEWVGVKSTKETFKSAGFGRGFERMLEGRRRLFLREREEMPGSSFEGGLARPKP